MKQLHKGIIYLVLACLSHTFVYAEKTVNKEVEAYLEKTRKITGDITENAATGKKVEDKRDGYFDNYMDTVIWNDTFKKKTDNIPQTQISVAGTETIILDTPVDKLKAEWSAEEARLAALKAQERNVSKETPIIFAGGYCTLDETLAISKSNLFGKLECMLDFGEGGYKRVEVFTGFYPDYKREMVIAIPAYMTFDNGDRAMFSGIVLKANKTSMNMASWVDNRRMQKMLAEGLLMTNDLVYRYADGYMRALIASKVTEEVVYPPNYDGNGSGTRNYYDNYYYPQPTSVRNVNPPEAKDYIISAGITLLTNIFSIVGKDYINSKEPLFAVYPQKVYVEGMVSFDNKGLAQRFGQISQSRQNQTNSNNQQWIGERNNIVNSYGHSKQGTVPAPQTNTRSNVGSGRNRGLIPDVIRRGLK